MKLIKITNRYYFVFTTIILGVFSVLLFYTLQSVTNKQESINLLLRNQQVISQIKKGGVIPSLPPYIEVKEIDDSISEKYTLKETYVLNPYENEKETFNELVCYKHIKGKNYKIIIRNALLDSDDYFSSFFFIIVFTFLAILISLFVINLLVTKTLWKSFYSNLQTIKDYSISNKERIELKKSNILEFSELNDAIEELVDKTNVEYELLKEFTENASHELQTPLAIVQSNLENLIQNLKLDEHQSKMLENISNSIIRMANLNQSLLLLAKLDNNQFDNKTTINASQIITKQIHFYKDLIAAKDLKLETLIDKDVHVLGNESLFEILISNIINNAIKHNIKEGVIQVKLTEIAVEITNTGEKLSVDPSTLFNRFKKSSNKNNSIGLGLAIVKKITDYFNWKVNYKYQNNLHTIIINF